MTGLGADHVTGVGQSEALKKLHPMAHTDRETDRYTDGYRDSKTESAQWADLVKIGFKIHIGTVGRFSENRVLNPYQHSGLIQ